jgi:tetratricopeptide (TPR) repeat protein
MPGTPPEPFTSVPTGSHPGGLEASSAHPSPAAMLAAVETELEHARARYAANSTEVAKILEGTQKRLTDTQALIPSNLEGRFALLDASLNTLQARVLSRKDRAAALRTFQRAAALFEKYHAALLRTDTRLRTDWGIALHRIGKNDESIQILSDVCATGVAPAEAFAYLGYGELQRGNLKSAEDALRKALDLAPTNLTMSFYLARVMELKARDMVKKVGAEQAITALQAAAEAYCRASEIAVNLADYATAGRVGRRALRVEPENERALYLTAECYRRLQKQHFALYIVDRFLTRQPNHPGALGLKGVLLQDIGNMTASVDVLRSIPIDAPNFAWAQAQLALSLSAVDASKMEEAIEVASRAVVLSPAQPFVHHVLGFLKLMHGDFQEAIVALKQAKNLGETSEDLAANLARALVYSKRYDEAEAELKAILAVNPRSAQALFLLGSCAEGTLNTERALTYYRRAARLAPNDTTTFVRILALLNTEELRPQALDEIEARLSGPLRYLALWYKGKLEILDEDWEGALQSLRQAAAAAAEERYAVADLPGILVDYGNTLRLRGQFEAAGSAYKRAYELDSSRRDVVLGKALWHCDVAEFAAAESCLKRGLDPASGNPLLADLWNLHGWCLQHLGDTPGAVESYRKSLELSEQKDAWSRKGLANVLMASDRVEATKHFESILEELKYQMDPEPVTERLSGNASILGLLGWCNYRLGRYDEAIRLYKSLLARSFDERSAQFDLGLVFLASGRFNLAAEAYQHGHEMTETCEPARRRGIYYIALFDLADARHLQVLGADSEATVQLVKSWLDASGFAVTALPWL